MRPALDALLQQNSGTPARHIRQTPQDPRQPQPQQDHTRTKRREPLTAATSTPPSPGRTRPHATSSHRRCASTVPPSARLTRTAGSHCEHGLPRTEFAQHVGGLTHCAGTPRGRSPPHRSTQPHEGQRSSSTTRCSGHTAAHDSFHHSCHTPPDTSRQHGQARLPCTTAHSCPADSRRARPAASTADTLNGPPSKTDRCIASTRSSDTPVAANTVRRTTSSDRTPNKGGRTSAEAPRRPSPIMVATSAGGQRFTRAIRSTHDSNASPARGAVTSANRRGDTRAPSKATPSLSSRDSR